MKRLALSAIIIALSIVASLTSAGERNTKYFAFVGEKMSIDPVSPESGDIRMDYEFIVKYRVLKSVYGAFDGEVIEFTVFDHHGTPRFSEHRHALLYVQQDHDGKYYHSKYMYSPLYQTAEGRWAGPYDAYDYSHEYNKELTIQPEPIEFIEPVSVDISQVPIELVDEYYPTPYYRIEGQRAIALYGNYVPELFRLKQHGILRARGDFQ
jgi:hypothetical protein